MMIKNPSCDIDAYLSNDDQSFDSDRIDSDIEAELYSSLHHEVLSMKPEDNTNMEQNHSINLISVTDNHISEDVCPLSDDLVPATGLYTNFDSPLRNKKNNDTQMIKNEKVALKRKSNLIANILDNIQVNVKMSGKKQKTVNFVSAREDKKNSSENITIEISDSDSSILSDSDESRIKHLQTNIEDTFSSSDSESSMSSLNENSMFLNSSVSRENLSSGNGSQNTKDLWHINDADFFRSKRSSGRYHENAVSKCSKCNKKGHLARYCTEINALKCFICGYQHSSFQCELKICTNCFRFGHIVQGCPFPLLHKFCPICKMNGHVEKDCPDLWRRYHLTTTQMHIVKGKLQLQCRTIYCFNCGLDGHYGYQCNTNRRKYLFPTWPSVVSYAPPGREHMDYPPEDFNPNVLWQPNCHPHHFQIPTIWQVNDRIQNQKNKKSQKKLKKEEKKKLKQLMNTKSQKIKCKKQNKKSLTPQPLKNKKVKNKPTLEEIKSRRAIKKLERKRKQMLKRSRWQNCQV